VQDKVSGQPRNRLGIAIAKRTYKAYRELLVSSRWRKLANSGARLQRLLWASTGTKDLAASDTLYISLLYLCGVKAMNPTYEQPDRLAVMLDDIKAFRQAGSRCTGHPEYGWTSGVET